MNPLPPEDLLPPQYEGWNYENQIFENLVKEINPRVIIEVGSWKGMSAIKLYKAAENISKDFNLYCVDTWLGASEHMDDMSHGGLFEKRHGYPMLYFQFLSNMQHQNCLENLHPMPNTSANCARWFGKKKIKADLIYVDGSHEIPDVYYDCCNYWELLSPGGIMFGDDIRYGPVEACVNNFCELVKINKTEIDNNYWLVRKPAPLSACSILSYCPVW